MVLDPERFVYLLKNGFKNDFSIIKEVDPFVSKIKSSFKNAFLTVDAVNLSELRHV